MDNHTFRDSNPGTVFPVPGLGIEEFLIREYSFALSLTANCDLCVVTMVIHIQDSFFLGGGVAYAGSAPLHPLHPL